MRGTAIRGVTGLSATLACALFHLPPSLRQLNSGSKPPRPYYYDPRIHTLGNIGPGGCAHALIAPAFTKFLDSIVYNFTDVRRASLDHANAETCVAIDLCCGTGCSTRAIIDRFPDADVKAIDSSSEMIDVAKMMTWCPNVRYLQGAVEDYDYANDKFDLATCMFAMHEMPEEARIAIGSQALRALRPGKGECLVVDIDPEYIPNKMMLRICL